MISILSQSPLLFVIYLVALLMAIAVHEFSHAFVADKLGDPTPRLQGRVTLNPKAHIDLMGILFLFIDKIFIVHTIDSEEKINYLTAFKIGLYQCLAVLFPGLSRSAATIIGGMSLKLTRAAAAEFSFFLAVPTMFAATVYKLNAYYKLFGSFSSEQIKQLAIGNAVAFIVALIAINFFIQCLQKHGFRIWGFYRIIVGITILALIYTGYIN